MIAQPLLSQGTGRTRSTLTNFDGFPVATTVQPQDLDGPIPHPPFRAHADRPSRAALAALMTRAW